MYQFISFFAGNTYPAFDLEDILAGFPDYANELKGNAVFFREINTDTVALITVTKFDVSGTSLDVPIAHETPLTGEQDLQPGETGFNFNDNVLMPDTEKKPHVSIQKEGADIYLNMKILLKGIKRDHAVVSATADENAKSY